MMNEFFAKTIALGSLVLVGLPSVAGAGSEGACECECGKQHLLPAATGNIVGRKYARDRLADILHVALDVTPDFAQRKVSGTMTMNLTPVGLPLRKFELDAVDLDISKVQANPPLQEWQNTGEKLVFWFPKELPPGTPVQLDVTFSAAPQQGLYFRTAEMGFPASDTQVWSQGEAELHRYWFPCYDYPNERFTSEVKCTVPEAMSVTSNGRLVGKQAAGPGLTTWHWKQEQPHVNYLIALAAGNFHRLEGKSGSIPLALSVPPSLAATAELAFRDTAEIMTFLQKEIGVDFPWVKYDQVYCHDFVAGGMENTSCTFLAAAELFPAEVETLESVESLDAHEMTHQWFGDLVTCRDWSHLWLNEGFASFYPKLFRAHKGGGECFQEELWSAAQRVVESNDVRPIVWRDYTDPMQQFDSRAYPKGAWVLAMLRAQLGADLFRKAIATYLQRHRNGIATSDDLQDVLEEISGRSFDRFFDQWVHRGGFPELAVSQKWDAATKLLTINVKQQQKVSDEVPLFHFPLPVKCVMGENVPAESATFTVTQAEENFTISLPKAPVRVECDPDFTVLAKWNGESTLGEKNAALDGPLHGRLRHYQKMAEDKSADNIALLKTRVEKDTSLTGQKEAVITLQKMQTKEAVEALISLLGHPEARIRLAVTKAVANSLQPIARDALTVRLDAEKNPRILAEIIESWQGVPSTEETTAKLAKYVESDSWEQCLAMAAIRALRSRNEKSVLPAILRKLEQDQAKFPARLYQEALDAAAFLSRNEPKPTATLALLTKELQCPRDAARVAAAKALGTLGNPAAISLLKPLAISGRSYKNSLKDASEAAITQINSLQQAPLALEKVWQELQSLGKKNQELEGELKKLKEAKPREKEKEKPDKPN